MEVDHPSVLAPSRCYRLDVFIAQAPADPQPGSETLRSAHIIARVDIKPTQAVEKDVLSGPPAYTLYPFKGSHHMRVVHRLEPYILELAFEVCGRKASEHFGLNPAETQFSDAS